MGGDIEWWSEVLELELAGDLNGAILAVHTHFDDAFTEGRFEQADADLVELTKLLPFSPDMTVSVLCATYPAHKELTQRNAFRQRANETLTAELLAAIAVIK